MPRFEVVQFCVEAKALLVSNDSYKDYGFHSAEFLEQIKERVLTLLWEGGEVRVSGEKIKEVWYPNLSSLAWRKEEGKGQTDRQRNIAEMAGREGELAEYERKKLRNMRELEEREGKLGE